GQLQRVVPPCAHLLSPVLVAQALPIEKEQALEELFEGGVALCFDGAVHRAEVARQRMRLEGHFGDDSEGTAAPAAQCPEEILILTSVRYQQLAIGGDHLRFEHARRGDPILLGPTAEATALNESAGGADRGAAAALDIATVLHRHFLVRFEPSGAC